MKEKSCLVQTLITPQIDRGTGKFLVSVPELIITTTIEFAHLNGIISTHFIARDVRDQISVTNREKVFRSTIFTHITESCCQANN